MFVVPTLVFVLWEERRGRTTMKFFKLPIILIWFMFGVQKLALFIRSRSSVNWKICLIRWMWPDSLLAGKFRLLMGAKFEPQDFPDTIAFFLSFVNTLITRFCPAKFLWFITWLIKKSIPRWVNWMLLPVRWRDKRFHPCLTSSPRQLWNKSNC